MPTGYTAHVADGEITSLRGFAMLCARGMGALITMRDEPLSAPLPEKLEPNLAYYGPELEKAQALLAELPGLTAEECDARAMAEYDRDKAWRVEATDRQNAQRERYVRLLGEVEAWDCRAEGLKDFMLDQLRKSIEFDCGVDYMERAPQRPMTGEEWRAWATSEAAQKVARYSEEVRKEHERTHARNAWLTALRESLPPADGIADQIAAENA